MVASASFAGLISLLATVPLVACYAPPPSGIQPIQISFNDQNYNYTLDIDGPWPTVPILYGNDSKPLDCYLTFWDQNIFVTQDACGSSSLCANGTFYEVGGPAQADQNQTFDMTNYLAQNGTTQTSTLLEALHLSGSYFKTQDTISLNPNPKANLPRISLESYDVIGTNLATTTFPNSSTSLPLINSFLSLSTTSTTNTTGKIQALFLNNSIPSASFGLHLGSVDPWVEPSLYLGGYDKQRTLGPLATWQESTPLVIKQVNIGVEHGFFPLVIEGSLTQNYSRGPWYLNVMDGLDVLEPVQFDPGVPYLQLSKSVCDALGAKLNLTYDPSQNLYGWNIGADQPLFHSPSYLEFVLDPSSISIKIPFRMLQNTFRSALMASNDTAESQKRYFPCNPISASSDAGGSQPIVLGRAFLQAAFIGAQNFGGNDTDWMIAQAPGPGGTGSSDVTKLVNGTRLTSRNGTLQQYAWTKSWSSDLPIWTKDVDGTPYPDADQNSAISTGAKIGIAVGAAIGVAISVLVCICVARKMRRSRSQKRQIRRMENDGGQLAGPKEQELFEEQKPNMVASSKTQSVSSQPSEISHRESAHRSRDFESFEMQGLLGRGTPSPPDAQRKSGFDFGFANSQQPAAPERGRSISPVAGTERSNSPKRTSFTRMRSISPVSTMRHNSKKSALVSLRSISPLGAERQNSQRSAYRSERSVSPVSQL